MPAFLIASSLFFATPAPLDMPRAEGWLVSEDDRLRIEDRYDVDDLWYSRTVVGCWMDAENSRAFTLADLEFMPPSVPGKLTRTDYEETLRQVDRREEADLLLALRGVSPVEVDGECVRSHHIPHAMKEVRFYEGTNLHAIVCAYRPVKTGRWQAAVWELSGDDDREEMRKVFEDKFWEELAKNEDLRAKDGKSKKAGSSKRRKDAPSERELLKRDAAHSVAAYESWHCTPGADFVILDDLPDGRSFVASLTNDLAVWRGRFAAALPTPVDASNALCVARIYRNRSDYIAAAGEEMQWTAAYWCPARRELVACLPTDGDRAELRKTFRHEAFHQYLSYATAMIPVSPWLNEGYAQYFENECRSLPELDFTAEQWDDAELALPGLMLMDYDRFYDGSDARRRTNYRLAWSIAFFMEQGMRAVRHDPFKNVKSRYFRELARLKDMRKATLAAFESEDQLKFFCNEWKIFCKSRLGSR